jgi:transcriptional regulator with XRE-family HTH domain
VVKSKPEIVGSAVVRLFREKRVALGLSMYAVSKRARISHSTITRIENGLVKPTLDMLLRIAEVMDIDLWILIKKAEARAVKKSKSKDG